MIKELKNIDFTTTGRQPSQEDFNRISEWIKQQEEITKKGKTRTKKIARAVIISK